MAEFTSYAPGTPCWVDLASRDVEAAAGFYAGLFGWEIQELGPDAGGYRMASKNGKLAAGLGPVMNEGQPAAWSTYICVADADAAVASASQAGAQVAMQPMDVFEAGRMAVLTDPTGAFVSLWQPRTHIGAGLANEPGAFSWNELDTRDTAAAEAFYSAVFGWTPHKLDMGGMAYTEWQLDGRPIGGMTAMPPQVPPAVPSFWLVYFAVEDCDAAVDTVKAGGGSVAMGPMDLPVGRLAVVADAEGAPFAVIKLAAGPAS
ncbi:MAG TPA: VOC family protein [Acidimicrobiales bacterium]|nr:VOC family protein [Acidimicrobiales bacterium]